MLIYKITNLVNKKFYIGKFTGSLKDFDNYWGSGILITRAINKYGLENFTKDIIDFANSINELNEKEIYWIELTNSLDIGYNLAKGGDGGDLSKFINYDKISQKNKISIKAYWDNLSIEERRNRCKWLQGEGNPMYGKEGYWKNKTFPQEMIDKMVANRQSLFGEGNPMYGKTHTDEACKKISNANMNNTYAKGYKHTDEAKYKMSENAKLRTGENNPFYGKTHTDETKQKISESRKGKRPSNCKAFIIDDVEYYSLYDAEAKLGIKATTIRHRILSKNLKYINYNYI